MSKDIDVANDMSFACPQVFLEIEKETEKR